MPVLSRRRFLLLAGSGLVLLPGCGLPGSGAGAALPVEALRQGGHVIYFRHGATDWQGNDSPRMPRHEQRNLSPEGIEQSRRIGRRFRVLRIPVGEVLASPFHRCIDMAELAFGRHQIEPRLLNTANIGAPVGRVEWLRAELARPVAPGVNRMLIGHSPNLATAAGITLAEGEAAIFRPDGQGGHALVVRVMPEGW